MSLVLETVHEAAVQGDLLEAAASPLTLSLQDFVSEFGDELLDSLNRANPPVYTGQVRVHRQLILAALKRKLFPAQADVVHAVTELLVDRAERAAIVNGEMGCGKTTVGIATAAVLNAEGYRRTLVLSPPHLVYKWRREIQETVAGAKVWVLNGPDTLVKLLKLREQLGVPAQGQEFFVLGRVRMRMGFHWKPVFVRRRTPHGDVGACPDCGHVITDLDGEPINPVELEAEESRRKCSYCLAPLWSLIRPRGLSASDQSSTVLKALKRIPTIGEVTAQKLMQKFGDAFLASMLGDNIHEFINLMDDRGELVFSDRQAHRMERAMANMEFGFGEGGYQPSEFIKRQLPQGTFDLLIADEGHVRCGSSVCPHVTGLQRNRSGSFAFALESVSSRPFHNPRMHIPRTFTLQLCAQLGHQVDQSSVLSRFRSQVRSQLAHLHRQGHRHRAPLSDRYLDTQALNHIRVRGVKVRAADTRDPAQFADGDLGAWVVSAQQDQGGLHTLSNRQVQALPHEVRTRWPFLFTTRLRSIAFELLNRFSTSSLACTDRSFCARNCSSRWARSFHQAWCSWVATKLVQVAHTSGALRTSFGPMASP